MQTSYALTLALLASALSVSAARAENPPIPPINCPPGTAPNILQVGGGGVNVGPVKVNLPTYTKADCPPVSTPTPSPTPTAPPKK